ncbi:hypothetical protein MTR_1g033820 [Medicago truncatula]|uniref:FAR1 DNA-binding domain protein n=1 Tax=Medicago truncatula TaxID=3880 RepID=A0A072VH00_MEDTR|nr:hypothetical protein MTR_1g033820 [Medicago truncatula]
MSNGLKTPSEVISSHETNDGDHPNLHPRIEMEFNAINDVKEFYISFSKKKGFGIRTRTTKEHFCTLVCSNELRKNVDDGRKIDNAPISLTPMA